MSRAYLELAKKSFQNNLVYRAEYIAGVLNAIVMIFVNISIWRAIYEEEGALEGLQFKMMATYVVLSFLLQTLYVMDEYFIEVKVRSGLISSDLLKPISFRMFVFSNTLGTLVFRLLLQLSPALLLSIILFQMLPPFSVQMALYFAVSALLGFLVLYNLNFLVWISSFWFYWTFSLVTIKDAAVLIFSGALIPVWFMPEWLADFVQATPFASIYSTPIQIYLGMIPEDEIVTGMLRQLAWVLILGLAGIVLWHRASRKLSVQGG
ncbi:ABC transporter permease [Gorillibacterium timonense]|uniref:ABC transporter permease n=1 Tax=Gorillibacterium timonense TaxID=1689269 RepID=UPI00071C3968|nr:ABC-2 family transporter protein [Gorillibacterium timonense]